MSFWVTLNYHLDEFGHFGDCSPKQIWIEEKISKLLFATGCSIEPYDSFILGTSSSSLNVNSSALTSGNFYNLSVNAGTVSDSRMLLEAALERKQEIKNIIISLIPSYTQGAVTEISAPNGWKLLISSLSLEVAIRKKLGLFKEPVFFGSWLGDTSSDPLNLVETSSDRIKSEVAFNTMTNWSNYFKINEYQINELRKILNIASTENINIVGYFHEYPYAMTEIIEFSELYQAYKKRLNSLFQDYGFIIFDLGEIKALDNKNDNNFFNGHHLSRSGSEKVFNYLNEKLN